jgi:hypothetical protein
MMIDAWRTYAVSVGGFKEKKKIEEQIYESVNLVFYR